MSSEKPPSGAELAEALMRTTHALRRFAGQPYVQRGWSTSRVLLMLAVAESDLRMGELKDRLGVTGRAITSLVDGLEADGLVRRNIDSSDRRAIHVEVTDKGHEHLAEIKALHDAHAEHTFAILSDADRASLLDILTQLRRHVTSRQLDDERVTRR